MSKTLEEIKEDYAINLSGYSTWDEFINDEPKYRLEFHNDQVAILYSKEQNKELVKWKESMMKVHNDLNLQEVGKVLEIKLGASIAPQVLPKVKELLNKNNELIEMLNKASERLYTVQSPSTSYMYLADDIQELLTKHK